MALEEDVLGLLAQEEVPLDDDQIAHRLGANRHYINAVCRRLAASHRIVRQRGTAGKLVNFIRGHRPPVQEAVPPPNQTRTAPSRRRVDPQERVEDLIAHFTECVDRFEISNAFPGPSLYFHERAIERRRAHPTVEVLLQDELFFEYVYAMLPAWGMHRMGKQAAKVGDFNDMVTSFRNLSEELAQVFDLRIDQIASSEEESLAGSLWRIIDNLKVSLSGTHIVAGSKALHHVLPDLVPPIDRRYTWRFFTGQTNVLSRGEATAFQEWFPLFCDIARRCVHELRSIQDRGGFMATGVSKIIDNAIIGYMQGLDEEAN